MSAHDVGGRDGEVGRKACHPIFDVICRDDRRPCQMYILHIILDISRLFRCQHARQVGYLSVQRPRRLLAWTVY